MGLFCKKLHDGSFKEWFANVLFVILILYISQAGFLSKNAKHFTYGRPDQSVNYAPGVSELLGGRC